MASKVKFNLRFEISNLNYPSISAHVFLLTAVLVASEAVAASNRPQRSQMTSEVANDLIFELSDFNYPCCHASVGCVCFYEMIKRRLIIIP